MDLADSKRSIDEQVKWSLRWLPRQLGRSRGEGE